MCKFCSSSKFGSRFFELSGTNPNNYRGQGKEDKTMTLSLNQIKLEQNLSIINHYLWNQ